MDKQHAAATSTQTPPPKNSVGSCNSEITKSRIESRTPVILEDPRATSATTLPSPGSGLAAPLPHASSLIPALPASRAWPHDHLGPRTRATWTVPASRLASLTLAPFSRRRYRECRCFTSLHFLALHPPALHHACSRHTLAPSCAAVSASQPPSCSAD